MKGRWVKVDPDDVRPGDMADHVSGTLDPRPVERVAGQAVSIRIGAIVTPYLPVENYTYQRWIDG